jgi:energy-coupling factor transport system permease protein
VTPFFEPFHPGIKVAATLLVVAATMLAGSPGALLAGGLLAAGALVRTPGAGRDFLRLVRRLRWVALFILLLHGWFSSGLRVWPALGAWSPYQQGLLTAGHLLGLLAITTALASALMRSTQPASLAGGIAWLLRPLTRLGLPVHRFARLLSWTVDRIGPVGREVAAVRDGMRLRPREGGIASRLQREALAARRILGRAREAADRNAEALYLRGGGGLDAPPAPAAQDWILLASGAALAVVAVLF